ncbi:MAG: sigma-70 family RNA polymerase sigma factor [Chitinophagales bacterium]|nr:sigma-70 family RNA polymerase sigma factor [Chitinophagales bacterium]
MNGNQNELEAFRKNPNQSVSGLYQNCRPKFIGWGKDATRTGVHDLADIFQNAVMIMVLNLESGRLTELVGTLCTYLFGIGKNLLQAFRRKQGRIGLPGDDAFPYIRETDAGAEEALMIQESEAQLWARVDALGEPGRSLLILTYRDGLNSQEIADVLGYSSPEVVRQLRKRFLDKLRKQ